MARPAVTCNMYEAKTKLSQLVAKAREGTRVILMNRGEPVAMIVPIQRAAQPRALGFLKGQIKLVTGWDAPIEDFKDYR